MIMKTRIKCYFTLCALNMYVRITRGNIHLNTGCAQTPDNPSRAGEKRQDETVVFRRPDRTSR